MKTILKHFITATILSTILVVSFLSLDVFIPGIELLLIPIMLVTVLLGFCGLVVLILYKISKGQTLKNIILTSFAILLGCVFAFFLSSAISHWDELQRNLSGKIITNELEIFQSKNGEYPLSFKQLDNGKLNSKLPKLYQLDRFKYYCEDRTYLLEILNPSLDKWQWDKNKKQFIFRDF